MREVLFEHVIVIGYGTVTGEILKYVCEKSFLYGYTVKYIEHEVHPFNMAKKYAETVKAEYHVIEEKDKLLDYLLNEAKERVLIISASNNFLFPDKLTSNENVVIINFHNALLPDLPGRNAPSWAIYEGMRATGITWHYVTKSIDAGDIIIQKKCIIENDTKAYELVATQMKLAAKAFAECFDDVLRGKVCAKKQMIPANRKIYKSFEIPAGGKFNLSDSVETIYRLLRAMDYGKNGIFPMPVTQYDGNEIKICRYRKINKTDKEEKNNRIYLSLDEDHLLELRYVVA